jgi:hypothetical protein
MCVEAPTANSLTYVVNVLILHTDENGDSTTVLDKETRFEDEQAIVCRKQAFDYTHQVLSDAEIDGKLCKYHLDTPLEGFFKKMKNVTSLSIEIHCDDAITGERLTISEGDFENPPEETLDACVAELMWYREYGYRTDGWDDIITDEDDNEHDILDFTMEDWWNDIE